MEWLPASLVFCLSALMCLWGTVERRERYCQLLRLWMGADSSNSCLCFCVCLRECSLKWIWQPLRVCTPLWSSFIWLTAVSGWGGRDGQVNHCRLWLLCRFHRNIHDLVATHPPQACSNVDLGKMSTIMTELVLIWMQCLAQIWNSVSFSAQLDRYSWARCDVWLHPLGMSNTLILVNTKIKNIRISTIKRHILALKDSHSSQVSLVLNMCCEYVNIGVYSNYTNIYIYTHTLYHSRLWSLIM